MDIIGLDLHKRERQLSIAEDTVASPRHAGRLPLRWSGRAVGGDGARLSARQRLQRSRFVLQQRAT